MVENEDKFKAISDHSFKSIYFSVSHPNEYNAASQFFKELYDDVHSKSSNIDEKYFTYFVEQAKYLILFHNVDSIRIAGVVRLFLTLHHVLSHFQLASNFDTKHCSCDEYCASGDCYCEIDDVF